MEVRLPVVKPEYQEYVRKVLVEQLFDNQKVGIVALAGALMFYYVMLIYDSGFEKQSFFLILQMTCLSLVAVFVFLFSGKISNAQKRLMLLFAVQGMATFIGGISFYFQVPAITDPNLRIAAFTFLSGVMSAAAFTFSSNKYIFSWFAAWWTGPILYYMFVISPDFSMKILGFLILNLFGVLIFLSRLEYGRSLKLILSDLETKMNLEEIRKLKTQQDGDYFLTSLLLKPLSRNHTESNGAVSVEFFTRQYKQFEFRNRQSEIGGDLSSAHSVELRGKPYTVFINADAMGKSIQGAGGALVLGAIFESIIERTKQRKDHKKMFPERWLKSAFLELHKAFESFDGTMLVSIVLGLLDNETGVLYFLNLEHPWAVLYRDAKADFIMQEHYYRKLGTTGLPGSIIIATAQLRPGDIVFIGSDGRDDIYHDDPVTQARIINEDESLFLRHVEKGEGNIERIVASIHSAGKIMDDLSLVRLQYHGASHQTEASGELEVHIRKLSGFINAGETGKARDLLRSLPEVTVSNPRYLKSLINAGIRCGEFEIAARFSEDYIRHHPLDHRALHVASVLQGRLKKYEYAADISERLYLRGLTESKYLEHLVRIHKRMGNTERYNLLRDLPKQLAT